MCGINGIVSTQPLSIDLIRAMNRKIYHRGPDEEGVYQSGNVLLGMRRLSIIDLKDGQQPIFNEDGRYVIVFNGEIYNYRELRQKLLASGHVLKTHSDTEVIVHLYEEKGEKCLDDLNGMFAFAIYDMLKKELFIARDRLGKKPLFYCFDEERFIFSSELKGILTVSPRRRALNRRAVDAYFAFTFIPAPLTIFEGIHKLEAGCFLRLDSRGEVTIRRYWDLAAISGSARLIEDKDACMREIRDLVHKSVEMRMIADVPLGAFLSGGIDSSIIVAVMSQISDQPIKTFTIGNTIKTYDESGRAKIIARHFRTDHTEWFVDNEYIVSIADKVLANFDEPFADSSALPTYVVAELARQHVKVVLTGDGGDELYAGYARYLIFDYLKRYSQIPAPLRRSVIKPLVNSLPAPASLATALNKARKIVNNDGATAFEQHHFMQRLGYSEKEILQLLPGNNCWTHARQLAQERYEDVPVKSPLSKALFTDIKVGLEGCMLAKVDRATMQNSLEARCPLLDYRLVEHSFSIPDHYKLNNGQLKYILKEAFARQLPPEILKKQKMGFQIPIGAFLRRELQGKMNGYLSSEKLAALNLVNQSYLKELYQAHCRGQDRTFQIWAFYAFALWVESFYDYIATNSHARVV